MNNIKEQIEFVLDWCEFQKSKGKPARLDIILSSEDISEEVKNIFNCIGYLNKHLSKDELINIINKAENAENEYCKLMKCCIKGKTVGDGCIGSTRYVEYCVAAEDCTNEECLYAQKKKRKHSSFC